MPVTLTTYNMPRMTPKVVKSALGVIQVVLEAKGCTGDFLAIAKTRYPGHTPGFKFIRLDHGQLICKVQPSGNDSAWEWWVTPPSGDDGEQIARRLNGELSDAELLGANVVPEDFDPDKVAAAIASGAAPSGPKSKSKKKSKGKSKSGSVEEETQRFLAEKQHAPSAAVIADRYEAAEQQAVPYAEKMLGLEDLQRKLQTMYLEIEDLEKQIKIQEQELAKDSAGKHAYEQLARIAALLDM